MKRIHLLTHGMSLNRKIIWGKGGSVSVFSTECYRSMLVSRMIRVTDWPVSSWVPWQWWQESCVEHTEKEESGRATTCKQDEETSYLHHGLQQGEPISAVTLAVILGLGTTGTGTGIASMVTFQQQYTQLSLAVDRDIQELKKGWNFKRLLGLSVWGSITEQMRPWFNIPIRGMAKCSSQRRMLFLFL